MVHEMTDNKPNIFVETLILAILILLIGFLLGAYVESLRVEKAIDYSRTFELENLDLKLQNYYYQLMDDASCTEAIKQNFIFADDLYDDGLKLEKYEEASQISEEITREKKRYVLLKMELWLNSLLLKEKCGGAKETFHTIVYFYSNDKKDLIKNGKQMVFSNILKQVKEKHGNKIVLLPIAGDLDLKSVDLQKRIYNITEFPSILIDEKNIITDVKSLDDIERYLVQ